MPVRRRRTRDVLGWVGSCDLLRLLGLNISEELPSFFGRRHRDGKMPSGESDVCACVWINPSFHS